jgi:hypothetical protein
LLGITPAADADTIKKAFRREIARYHPDKVTHLGPEFQEMASSRAAELTSAYKVLTDAAARAEYDAALEEGRSFIPPAAHGTSAPAAAAAPAVDEPAVVDPPVAIPMADATYRRFEQERAGRDEIVRRAILARATDVVTRFVGDGDTRPIKGFDVACLTRSRPHLFRRTPPVSVLVRHATIVDAAVAGDAWMCAVKAKLPQKPIVLLLIGNALAPASELARVIEDQRRRHPSQADTLFPVPVDARDWSAKIPTNSPEPVRALVDKLRTYVG